MATWMQDFLEEEQHRIGEIAATLVHVPSSEVDQKECRQLFSDLDKKADRTKTCLPMGIDLLHYLLVSGKSVCMPIRPCTDSQFEVRYRISMKLARELVEMGRLFLNVYDTEPESWANTGESVRELVKSAGFVNKYRVTKFFQLVRADYDECVERRRKQTEDALASLTPSERKELIAVAQVETISEISLVTGIRWGYLDAKDQESSSQAELYLQRRQLKEFIQFVRGATLLKTSRFSGSYGDDFIWGPDHLSVISDSQQWLTDRIKREKGFAVDKGALEYMLHELTKVTPFEIPDFVESRRFLKFIQDRDNSDLCEKIFDASGILSELVLKNHDKRADGLDFNSYKEAVSELQEKYRKFKKYSRAGAEFATDTIIIGALAPLVGIIGAIAIGGSIIVLKTIFQDKLPKVEAKLYDLFDPSSRKMIATVEEIRKKRNEI